MKGLLEKMRSKKTAAILAVQSTALKSMTNFFHEKGFTQMMPVILSPITDPLAHSVFDASIDYCGQKLQLTKSMILHKQIALSCPDLDKIFIVSPNVRLEKPECGEKGRYLIEFTQIDWEMRKATKKEFMDLTEEMVVKAIGDLVRERKEELGFLGRKLSIPSRPFPVYESKEWRAKFGDDFEAKLSARETAPFWVLDHAREFYDKEDEKTRGYYHNYDLYYPEGFGEGLSGAERDYEYSVLKRKLAERGQKEEEFGIYMKLSKEGHLSPSAGGGIGIERFVRYACGLPHIREVGPFAKVPGDRFVV